MSRNYSDRYSNRSSNSMANASRPPRRGGASGAWGRLKPPVIDALDVYGLPSKGETRLNDPKTQETYYGKIVERYMKFCASSGGSEELEKAFMALSMSEKPPITQPAANGQNRPTLPRQVSTTERPNDLNNILMAMRKLREGMLSSRRKDAFAQRAYMFIIHVSILTRHWESYQPALQYLLYQIHPHTPLSPPELQEFSGYRILDLACRQRELMDAFAVKKAFKQHERKVNAVLKALVQDDWVRFWRTKGAVDGYQRAIMEHSVEGVRLHALKCLGRGYLNADKAFVERSTDAKWDDLVTGGVGWQLQESGNVVIRKPKSK